MEKVGIGTDSVLHTGIYPQRSLRLPVLVLTDVGNGPAYLASLEFITPILVVISRRKYDVVTGARQLGTVIIWVASNAASQQKMLSKTE